MKLLICLSEYPPIHSSGIGNVAHDVIKKLRSEGIECIVCSPTGPDIKLGSSLMIQKFGIIGLLFFWYGVSKYFKENDFDASWFHNPLFLIKTQLKRSIITIHTTYYGFSLQKFKPEIYYKISSIIEKHCLKNINHEARFTVVSPHLRNELKEIGINTDNIAYIPNGVDTEVFKPSNNKKKIRKSYGIPENDIIILSLGRLTEAKQPKKLIEVFNLIEKKNENVTLVIAGSGELLEETKKFVKEENISKIIFLGYVDHDIAVPELFACSDYYIMSSRYEGQPLSLLEAISSGLPCIVSDIPNLRLVEDANCGIIVDFSDVDKTSERISEYIKKDNSKHRENARRYAEENLDWNKITKKYLEVVY